MGLAKDNPLFLNAQGAVTPARITEVVRAIGVEAGDVVMVHAELLRLGRIPQDLLAQRQALFEAVEDALLEAIGPAGTLLMPTFTTGCLAHGPFDQRRTPSETGALSEHFRLRAGVQRTPHPTHSMAVLGAQAGRFMRPPAHPFGEGSAFDVLKQLRGKLLFLGADFHWCTFIHHMETAVGVPYRKPVPVRIKAVLEGPQGVSEERELPAFRFKRPDRYWPDFERLRLRAVERGILHETVLGKGYVAAVAADALFREGTALLKEDPHAFVDVQPWSRYLATKASRILRRVNDRLPPFLRPY
ncbi:MAG: AAC(3) family N-acetyltransferase [Flavobacteriales bacterium]|nr:AAC(3) family N-acetyltransferase [Flavobacteriales bacterium]